jgi:hypothetical protein
VGDAEGAEPPPGGQFTVHQHEIERTARGPGNRRLRRLGALRAHTKAPIQNRVRSENAKGAPPAARTADGELRAVRHLIKGGQHHNPYLSLWELHYARYGLYTQGQTAGSGAVRHQHRDPAAERVPLPAGGVI